MVVSPLLGGTSATYPQILSDGSGGAVVVWYDNPTGQGTIFASRFGPDGTALWSGQPVIVSGPTTSASYPQQNFITFRAFPTHDGALAVFWVGPSFSYLYGEKIRLSDGAALWGPQSKGVPISRVVSPTWFDGLVDSDNGVTLAFNNNDNQVLLKHVLPDGTLGTPLVVSDGGTGTDAGMGHDAGTGNDAGNGSGTDGGVLDAGTGTGPKTGCGCNSTGGDLIALAALALLGARSGKKLKHGATSVRP